jgi:hypothetical protein
MGKEFKVYENPITVLKVEESKILRNDKDSTLDCSQWKNTFMQK